MIKMRILDSLHREAIINQSKNELSLTQVMQPNARPKSSLGILKKKQNNTIKLGSLIDEIETTRNSIAMKQHIVQRKSKRIK